MNKRDFDYWSRNHALREVVLMPITPQRLSQELLDRIVRVVGVWSSYTDAKRLLDHTAAIEEELAKSRALSKQRHGALRRCAVQTRIEHDDRSDVRYIVLCTTCGGRGRVEQHRPMEDGSHCPAAPEEPER